MSWNVGHVVTLVLVSLIGVPIGLLLADHWWAPVFQEERRLLEIRRVRVEEACRKLYEFDQKEGDRG